MRAHLLRAPLWLLAVLLGVPMALALGLGYAAGRGSTIDLTGVLIAVAFGAVMGSVLALALRSAVRHLPDPRDLTIDVRKARRESLSGPVPIDPGDQAASRALLDHEVGSPWGIRTQRWTFTVLTVLWGTLSVVDGSLIRGLAALGSAVAAIACQVRYRHLHRRQTLFAEAEAAGAPAG